MPALRDRGDDVPQIVDFILQNLVKQKKARVSKVAPEAMQVLIQYKWPGNVRELENVIYRSAVIAQGDTILVKDLPTEIREAVGAVVSPATSANQSTQVSAPVSKTIATNDVSDFGNVAAAVPLGATESQTAGSGLSNGASAARVSGPLPVADQSTAGALTVDQALDFLHRELSTGEEPILSRLEREMIQRVVRAESGNLLRASEKLGITRSTLRKRVDELGLRV
jgi:two-component system nitrogen regulation response regulator GlnG